MPWEERTVSQMRKEFVLRVLASEKSKSALCREYGISRPTGDKWIARYQAGEPLEDRSKRPHKNPRKTPPDMEKLIVDRRKEAPVKGATSLHRILLNEGVENLPCPRTINNIFARNGLITKEASEAATPYKRFEKEEPNEMWQSDFKGNFLLANGQKCFPLNVLDDHSRYNLCCTACAGESFKEIKPVMIRMFEEYGVPFSFLCDNGNPWGTSQSPGFTKFEVWMMEHNILVLHGRVWHPQTQGKTERFNRTLKRELLNGRIFADMKDAQRCFDEYREYYNSIRPHHALNLDTPSTHYHRSNAEYTDEVPAWDYPGGCELRRVKSSGYITLDGQGYYLSEAFGGKDIAVKRDEDTNRVSLLFRQFRIAELDVERRVFTYRRAYLIENDPRQK